MSSLRSAVVSRLPHSVAERLRATRRTFSQRHWVDEPEIVARIAANQAAGTEHVLVDVGACYGAVTEQFLALGWSVVAYEPDPSNRLQFAQRIGANPRVQLSAAAVSDKPAKSVPFFSSSVSVGISTLAAFHETHEPTARVDVTTLARDLIERGVQRVDFLKVDIEGFDFFALKGFDWALAPQFVLYEFEDRKTVPLGYSLSDSSAYIANLGYFLVYSVWEPIIEYGAKHRWRGLYRTPPVDVSECWGNVLCFRDEADALQCMKMFDRRRWPS